MYNIKTISASSKATKVQTENLVCIKKKKKKKKNDGSILGTWKQTFEKIIASF